MSDRNDKMPFEEHLENIIRKKTEENSALKNLLDRLEEKEQQENATSDEKKTINKRNI